MNAEQERELLMPYDSFTQMLYTWGIKFASRVNGDLTFSENSELTHNNSIKSWTKYLPASAYESNAVNTDAFQNNFFSLEKIRINN